MSLILDKLERWTVKKFGFKKSLMKIGWLPIYHSDSYGEYLTYIPHHIYNRTVKDNLRIDYFYEYKKDEYSREWLVFVDTKSNKIVYKLLIEAQDVIENK